MSYYCSGGGTLVPKKDVKLDDVLFSELSTDCQLESTPEGRLWVGYEYGRNDGIEDDMNFLAPYIDNGDVVFTGEDSEKWRYHFDKGTVKQQVPTIVWEDE